MSLNFLHLNEGKTEIIVFESSQVSSSPGLNLGNLSSCVKPVGKNLGVFFDSAIKFDKQIRVLVKVKLSISFKDSFMLLFQ